jgi:hypothetical protein
MIFSQAKPVSNILIYTQYFKKCISYPDKNTIAFTRAFMVIIIIMGSSDEDIFSCAGEKCTSIYFLFGNSSEFKTKIKIFNFLFGSELSRRGRGGEETQGPLVIDFHPFCMVKKVYLYFCPYKGINSR